MNQQLTMDDLARRKFTHSQVAQGLQFCSENCGAKFFKGLHISEEIFREDYVNKQ